MEFYNIRPRDPLGYRILKLMPLNGVPKDSMFALEIPSSYVRFEASLCLFSLWGC